ncbi:MAG: peptidase M22, partial [Ruminococcus sp.]|nr:peptidase M22 [Ruminococcus sp.]
CQIVAKTLDLNAGQLIDRTGMMLGLDFPCGKELEKLALQYKEPIKVKPSVKGTFCSLSGFQNKLQDIYKKSNDKYMTSAYALAYVQASIAKMTEEVFALYGEMPVVFAGGVMSNSIIRKSLENKFDAYFAQPEFSCDNAAGCALLGGIKFTGNV